MRRIVAAPAAQLEKRLRRSLARFQQRSLIERRLLGVVGGSGHQRPPLRQFVIELWRLYLPCAFRFHSSQARSYERFSPEAITCCASAGSRYATGPPSAIAW